MPRSLVSCLYSRANQVAISSNISTSERDESSKPGVSISQILDEEIGQQRKGWTSWVPSRRLLVVI